MTSTETLTIHRGTRRPTDREVTMFNTTTARDEAILFAATYPTPNVRRAVELAEAGTVTWEQVRDLFAKSLGSALTEVST